MKSKHPPTKQKSNKAVRTGFDPAAAGYGVFMKELIINNNDEGQRLDKFITKSIPALPLSLLYKYIRIKRIKVNGARAARDYNLIAGDIVNLYINDEFFNTPDPDSAFFHVTPALDILYEDQNILLVNKKPGIVVHDDETGTFDTLINHIKAYLYRKNEWVPGDENSFVPALCNRIDRNTGGIVIAAKNAPSLRILNEKIKNHEIKKYYLCVIHGKITPSSGKLQSYLLKDEQEKRVHILSKMVPGAKTAVTLYKTLAVRGDLSLVECELFTGRTHQIRAQFAAAGHPLLGDGKYGTNQINEPYKTKYQALYAYKVLFDFISPSGILSYLSGQVYSIEDVEFSKNFHKL